MEDLAGGLRPVDFDLAVLRKAISQIQVDEALVRHASLFSHAFEIHQDVFRQPHGDGLLQFGRVAIPARRHLFNKRPYDRPGCDS